MKTFFIEGKPVPAPRMTRADSWKKRPCVIRYRDFRDRIREIIGGEQIGGKEGVFLKMLFIFSPIRKKDEGKPHIKRPDVDNLAKAVLDSIFKEDGLVYKIEAEKRYCKEGEKEGVYIIYSEND